MKDMVLVPVHWKYVGPVRALLEQLESEGRKAAAESEDNAEWPREVLRKVYEDCSDPTKRILRYLSERPGKWVYGQELMTEAVSSEGKINIGPYLSSLTTASKRHHTGEWPIKWEQDPRSRLLRYMMPPGVAEIVRSLAS